MMTYINKEKQTNLRIIKNRHQLLKSFKESVASQKYSKWVVLATGSSANAIECSRYFVEYILGIEVDVKMPFIVSNYDSYVDKNALYFAVSQGGHSYSTIEALKKISVDSDKPVYTITADVTSPIAKVSDHIIDIGCGIESVGFVTMGVSATILTFMLMGLEAALLSRKISTTEYDKYIKQLEDAVDQMDDVIKKSNDWYDNNKIQLVQGNRFVVIGYGPGFGVAKEAETKITETVRRPVNGHELEEYMHGPYIALSKDDYVFFIETNGKLKEREMALRKYISKYTQHTYSISYNLTSLGDCDCNLGIDCTELISSLLMVIPIQVLSYRLAEDKGNHLNIKTFTDFDDKLKSKI